MENTKQNNQVVSDWILNTVSIGKADVPNRKSQSEKILLLIAESYYDEDTRQEMICVYQDYMNFLKGIEQLNTK